MAVAMHSKLADIRQCSFDFTLIDVKVPGWSLQTEKSEEAQSSTDTEKAPHLNIHLECLREEQLLPLPAKVLSAFDWREIRAERENSKAIKTEEVAPIVIDIQANLLGYPNEGRSNYDWTEAEIRDFHIGMLRYYVNYFSLKFAGGEKSKLEALEWIFGFPEVYEFRVEKVRGREIRRPIPTHEIPFTFHFCCRMAEADPQLIQQSVEKALKSTGQLHLLDQI